MGDNQNFATRVGKVRSEARAGGFSTVLSYEPDTEREAKKGSLYFAGEVDTDSPSAPDFVYNLIETIKEEYYKRPDEDPETSFERALKVVNQELKELASEGEKSWLGNLNFIAAAAVEDKLFLVHRGTAEAHLVRDSNILHITENLYTPGETYKPEETLVNMLEGDIQAGDKLIFSTAELFYYYSVEQVRRLTDKYKPSEAVKRIAGNLRDESDIEKTNVLIVEFNIPDLVEEKASDPTEAWANQPKKKKGKSLFGNLFNKSDRQTSEEEAEDESEPKPEPTQTTSSRKISKPDIDLGGFSLGSIFKKKQIQEAKKALNWLWSLIWKGLKGFGRMILIGLDWLIGVVSVQVRKIKRRKGGNKILIGIVVVIIGVLAFSSYALIQAGQSYVNTQSAQEKYEQAMQTRDEAEAELVYENEPEAERLFSEALTLADEASENGQYRERADELANEITQSLNEITDTVQIDSTQLLVDFNQLQSELPSSSGDESITTRDFTVFNGDVFAFDENLNLVYKYNNANGETGVVGSVVSNNQQFREATIMNENIYISTTSPSLFSYNPAQNTLEPVSLTSDSEWHTADDLLSFGTNLYFLDSGENQIWKYTSSGGSFTSIAPFFQEGDTRDLSDAREIAIDGSIYTLNGESQVQKFLTGQLQDFSLGQTPQHTGSLESITDIYTTDNLSDIYVLDNENDRILTFTKEGEYSGQFIVNEMPDASEMIIGSGGAQAYLLSNNQIYRINL